MTAILNYDKIKGLVYTEKSNGQLSLGKYTFKIDKTCTKSQLKSLIKKIYNVEVIKVNIINTPEKNKRFKGVLGTKGSIKKATITLKDSQTINFGS
jgi:large subunit ribosomal protein L23